MNLQSNTIREHLFNLAQIEHIVHYRKPVFHRATVDTEVTVFRKRRPQESHQIEITVVERDGKKETYDIPQKQWQEGKGKPVNIFERPELQTLVAKLRRFPLLDNLVVITQGAKPFQVGKGKPRQTQKIVDEKPFVAESKRNRTFRPLLRGSLIFRYQITWDKDYWISFGDWLAEPRYSANYDAPRKIVIRQTGDSLVATLDDRQFIVRDNLYSMVPRTDKMDLRYILGFLNSHLLNWFYQNIVNPERGEALA